MASCNKFKSTNFQGDVNISSYTGYDGNLVVGGNTTINNSLTVNGSLVVNQSKVHIGTNSGITFQSLNSVCVGSNAGNFGQGSGGVSIGYFAGNRNQGNNSISLGSYSGQSAQNDNAICIGKYAGNYIQGENSIGIGAYAGQTLQPANSIVLNASGTALNGTTMSSCYVRPIRNNTGSSAGKLMFDDTATYEVQSASDILNDTTGLTINKSNVSINGNLAVSGTLSSSQPIVFSVNTEIVGTFQVDNISTFYGNMTANSNLSVAGALSAGSLVVGGAVSVSSF